MGQGSMLVSAIDAQATCCGDRVAFENSKGERITYDELKRQSDMLARRIACEWGVPSRVPIVIYGHKSPLMIVAFLACAKSGHAYVPIDVVYPRERVASIIGQLGETVAIDTTGASTDVLGSGELCRIFGTESLEGLEGSAGEDASLAASASDHVDLGGVGADDTFYILFTSGSTGTPKGVEVTTSCVDGFYRWLSSATYMSEGHRVWFNRSPFTFDVSLTDIAVGLTRGDTLFALESEADRSLALAFEALGASGATDWVSTPSFVEMCLADESFNAELLPELRRMLLAGEVLRPETVRLAQERFPGLRVFNGYGPTESTDLVTLCEITDAMLESDRALPIGYAKDGSRLVVLNPDTLEEVPNGQPGELFVIGDTVARGYWGRDDLTETAFRACPAELTCGQRSYRTGDEVIREDDGLYYYRGRLDLQIKLHGYRIELGDIESVLCTLDEVHMACVLPVIKNDAISHLTAFVVCSGTQQQQGFALTKHLKAKLADVIPSYMIPRSFRYIDEMPLNPSGKADRKALRSSLSR